MPRNLSSFVVFDIGSNKIAAMEAQINNQNDISVTSEALEYSKGFNSGSIINMKLAETSIMNAIYELEKNANKSINEVTISLSGAGVKSYYITHKIKLSGNAISKHDVNKLINKALENFTIKDQEIIHYFPLEFIIDSRKLVKDPVGIYAKELLCQLHIVAADSLMLMNLTSCFAKCHVEVTDIILSIYADSMSCLKNDEKDLGSVIVDIGGNTTSFAIVCDNQILYIDHIPFGGKHITTDIAKHFLISRPAAEKLKILYGNANFNLLTKDTSIRLRDFEPDDTLHQDLSITIKQLSKIIQPKMESLFYRIKKQCNNISMNHLLAQRVVITGGSSAMSGVKNLAAEIFQKQVRIAKPEMIHTIIDNYNPYIYSTVLGMIKLKSLKSNYNENSGWLNKILSWLKNYI